MTPFTVDLRDACRTLVKDRGYASIVVLTLALTIGATTAVFSLVDGVLLKPLAYREPQQLVSIREVWRELADRLPVAPVNVRHFEYWRAHARSFESLVQYIVRPANLTGLGDAAQITVLRASGSLFDVLAIDAAMGRVLAPADETAAAPAAVLTQAFWRQRLGGDPAAIGRPLTLDGVPHTIVGVLPAGFQLPDRGRLTDRFDAVVAITAREIEQVGWVGDHNNSAIGRLRAGVTIDQARAELALLQRQVGATATAEAHEPVTLTASVTPLDEAVVGDSRRGLLTLLGAIGAVLLIACSNLANLSLTRALARQRDAVIRTALGASRARLVRLRLIEQLVLAAIGGALGTAVAWAALRVFVRTAAIDLPRIGEAALDARVLGFTAVVSMATGLLVAIAPSLRAARSQSPAAWRASGLATTADRGALRTRGALLALQVGLSVTLLVVTALMSLSLVRLTYVERGFDAGRVLVADVALPAARYQEHAVRVATYDRLLASIASLPGVESAATTSMVPLSGEGQTNGVAAEGDTRPRSEYASANFRFIAPGYFRTLGMPIVRGRTFTAAERDPARPAPALVSQRTAAALWPGGDAIGRRFSRGFPAEQAFEVVGIVADARTTSLEATPPLMVYAPYWWRSRPAATLVVRAAVDGGSLVQSLRRSAAAIDPEIAIGSPRSLGALLDAAFATRRYYVRLVVAFGAAALVIAMLGIYATTSYGVSRRRREMNIRVALGAQTSQVIALVLREVTMPIAAGLAAGVAGALGAGGIVASLLFQVKPRDPLVIAGVALLVGAIGLAACVASARNGLSLDPASALREE